MLNLLSRPSLLSHSWEVQSKVKDERLNNQTHKKCRNRAWAYEEHRNWSFCGSTPSGKNWGQGFWRSATTAPREAHVKLKTGALWGARIPSADRAFPCSSNICSTWSPWLGGQFLRLPSCLPAILRTCSSWRWRLVEAEQAKSNRSFPLPEA